MNSALTIIGALTLILMQAMPVLAAQSLGGVLFDSPCCAPTADGTGDLTCAGKGTNLTLYGIRFNPSTNFSTGFKELGGQLLGHPSCDYSSDLSGDVVCAVKGLDSSLYGIKFDPRVPVSSTGLKSLGAGQLAGNPSCAAPKFPAQKGDLVCAGRGINSGLYAIAFNPTTNFSSGLKYLGGEIIGDPSCTANTGAPGTVGSTITCGVRGVNNALYLIDFDPRTGFSTGFMYLGGESVGNPSCVATYGVEDEIQITCTVRGVNNALWGIRYIIAAKSGSGFVSLGGTFVDDPICAASGITDAAGNSYADCVTKGTNNELYSIDYTIDFNPPKAIIVYGANGPFTLIDTHVIVDEPSCQYSAVSPKAELTCAFKGLNNALFGLSISPFQ